VRRGTYLLAVQRIAHGIGEFALGPAVLFLTTNWLRCDHALVIHRGLRHRATRFGSRVGGNAQIQRIRARPLPVPFWPPCPSHNREEASLLTDRRFWRCVVSELDTNQIAFVPAGEYFG